MKLKRPNASPGKPPLRLSRNALRLKRPKDLDKKQRPRQRRNVSKPRKLNA